MTREPDERQETALRWSLALWGLTAALLLWLAPPPPPPPVTSVEDEAIFQRTVDQTVEKTRDWQLERGDQTIAWEQARGHLAVVIDDVGGELQLFEQLHALRFPLTFSVLPGAVYAPGVQLRLRADRRRPREILLHLPCAREDLGTMSGAESGELVLRAGDPPSQLQGALMAALARVPGAVGVSDPRGSWLSAERAAMDALMPVLRTRGLFLLDSRTSPHGQGLAAAEAAGLPALGRDLFLDADPSPAAVLAQLELAAQRAETRPQVVIAHPSPVVVETLREGLPRLHARGIGVYPLSELLARQAPVGPK